jgi:hypothetical protein
MTEILAKIKRGGLKEVAAFKTKGGLVLRLEGLRQE